MIDQFFGLAQTILAFVLVLAPLVLVHELGHFLVAKWFGIGAPVFSLGFGPRLFGLRRGGTDYRVSLIPLGGYVRLAGDEADEQRRGDPEEFLSRPRYQRFLVFVAGAAFNIVTAFVALWVLFAWYGRDEAPQAYPLVESVAEGGAAAKAGVRAGDRLLAVAGNDLKDPQRMIDVYVLNVYLAPNATKSIVVEREGEPLELPLTIGVHPTEGSGDPGWTLSYGQPAIVVDVFPNEPAQRAGLLPGDRILGVGERDIVGYLALRLALIESPNKPLKLHVARGVERLSLDIVPRDEGGQGKIGAMLSPVPTEHRDLSIAEAAGESLRTNVQLSKTLFVVLKRLVSRELPLRTMSGPIGIAQHARQALVAGAENFLWLLGFFSLQLGILNLLPIPVLDGGHILILLVEGTLRRELSERLKERVMQAGFVFLLAFMGVIVYLDVVKLL